MSEPVAPVRIGIVSISDRASSGVYEDKGLPALQEWLSSALLNPIEFQPRLIPDERPLIAATLRELVDEARCDLVLTTGGTGPALRDVTPEATLDVADREMPGFGEQMRQISLTFRAHRHPLAPGGRDPRARALILNLPGQPKAIAETLEGLKNADGSQKVNGIFAAVPYCIDLIGGPYLETRTTRSARPSAPNPPCAPRADILKRRTMKITKDTIVTLHLKVADRCPRQVCSKTARSRCAYLHRRLRQHTAGLSKKALEGQEPGFAGHAGAAARRTRSVCATRALVTHHAQEATFRRA